MKFRKSKEERNKRLEKRARKWGSRAAHHPWAFTLGFTAAASYYFIFLIILIQAPYGLLSLNVWVARLLILLVVVAIPTFPTLLFGILMAWRHNDNLCPICFGKFPLDPQEEVKKQNSYLKTFHGLNKKIFIVPTVATVLGLLIALLLLPIGVFTHLTWMVYLAFGLYLYSGIGLSCLGALNMTHMRLQPWCPYCDHRRDWDDEERPIFPEPVSGSN
ncbi:MAG TPA: hypothetical protein VLN58_02350 [Verrucomicrobiae bacterium]|nr:hypothetical protein [Verrucomicrobiae bacterium]